MTTKDLKGQLGSKVKFESWRILFVCLLFVVVVFSCFISRGWYRHDLSDIHSVDEAYCVSLSQWLFDGVCSTPLAARDQVQLTWSAVFDVDAHVSLSCPRHVQWGKGFISLLAMIFDRCCAGGGEHWRFVHDENGHCCPENQNVDLNV